MLLACIQTLKLLQIQISVNLLMGYHYLESGYSYLDIKNRVLQNYTSKIRAAQSHFIYRLRLVNFKTHPQLLSF